MQFPQHARQFLARDVKKRRIGEDAVEILIRQIELKKSCCHTAQPLWDRAMAAKRADPSKPIAMWPSPAKTFKSRPGPQPKSSNVRGSSAAMCCSIAAMFCVTSCSRVPSQNASARWCNGPGCGLRFLPDFAVSDSFEYGCARAEP